MEHGQGRRGRGRAEAGQQKAAETRAESRAPKLRIENRRGLQSGPWYTSVPEQAFHVIGVGQATSDLPEHRHMKGVDGGYTGEEGWTLDMRTRGMGGLDKTM